MSDSAEAPFIFADQALSRRLERAEASSSAAFVTARALAFPDSGARWIEVAGAYAMFDGVSSPITQTFGLGMFRPVTSADLDALEQFFRERGAPVCHEVSPQADSTVLALLNERGYRPIEFTSILFRPIGRGTPFAAASDRVKVRLARPDEQELWAEIAGRGWEATGELADFVTTLGRINLAKPDPLSFLAELDGQPIATGSMHIGDGVAMLAGASTIPEARKQGAQLALLNARLRYAVEQGCDLAMMGAAPGSGSQRNAERHGFRIAYTRIKWQLASGAA